MVSKKHPQRSKTGPLAILAIALLTSNAQGQAGGYQVEKVSLEFHELIRVELQGMVRESSDPTIRSMTIPFLQSLHYLGSSSRTEHRSFPSMADLRNWIQNDVCKEFHELTLNPLRETGSIGLTPIKSKLRPFSVQATGTRIETKGAPISEVVYCKPEKP